MKKPIQKLNIGQCPNCLKYSLHLKECEETITKLDEMGIPINDFNKDESEYTCNIVCVKCGSKFKAKKIGMHFCIDTGLPKIQRELKDYNPFQL